MNIGDIALARKWAEVYRSRGFNPLPSRTDGKRPCLRYRQYLTERLPREEFEKFPTPNIQVVCGQPWGLVVVDCDGAEAIERFVGRFGGMRHLPATWISSRGDGSLHVWFRLPAHVNHSYPKAVLWKGAEKHSAIERLGDKSLIVAPPSIHITTGERYKFLQYRSPLDIHLPAIAPNWLINWPAIVEKPAIAPPRPIQTHRTESSHIGRVAGRFHWRDVLASIPDKVALAKAWGVRFTGRGDDWAQCHAIDRADANPSAAVHRQSGYYRDLGPSDAKLSFLELAVALGAYADKASAINDLATRYLQHGGCRSTNDSGQNDSRRSA